MIELGLANITLMTFYSPRINSLRCLLTLQHLPPPSSSFYFHVSLIFHSAWLVSWQGDIVRSKLVWWWVALPVLHLCSLLFLLPCNPRLFLIASLSIFLLQLLFTAFLSCSHSPILRRIRLRHCLGLDSCNMLQYFSISSSNLYFFPCSMSSLVALCLPTTFI